MYSYLKITKPKNKNPSESCRIKYTNISINFTTLDLGHPWGMEKWKKTHKFIKIESKQLKNKIRNNSKNYFGSSISLKYVSYVRTLHCSKVFFPKIWKFEYYEKYWNSREEKSQMTQIQNHTQKKRTFQKIIELLQYSMIFIIKIWMPASKMCYKEKCIFHSQIQPKI